MIIYLCIKYKSNTPIFIKKNIEKKFFEGEKKGCNSNNYGWILP